MKILANDGISQSGIDTLEKNGFEVRTTKVAQRQLENYINEHQIDAILVKNSTQIHQELIEACPSIKLIGCAGLHMDNIDAAYAHENGVLVINTPTATSNAVAELVFAHLFGMVRFLHQSNREMPLEGETRFNSLRKEFSKGIELRGKTLGILGLDATGKEVAKIALGIGMNVIATSDNLEKTTITIPFYNGQSVMINIDIKPAEELFQHADFITIHKYSSEYIIKEEEFRKMKDGVGIINTAQAGALDEVALVNAIETGKVRYAALDVFENEPTPEIQLLMNPEISMTPHIGSATMEAENRMGTELAQQIVKLLSE
ncbi:D-3-phosphoglycerate dehydrogenase [Tenacibaculum maritimum]|uniref:NAD(P)-dependent oxidoreductase n=1 Tax=Tenacibaculum maritimum TaxID=107401 RepID=UPI0012E6CF72|nr:NAD(P)-dependent oxidoreductase [Tenacibaculum maritimum]CAA0184327.1 D-3-phosphoglycerate dehydrogenase [Tenacibaculum maritimum]CAA0256266.1 D-3-phosphoglycerate dehydrogenase [Tenacibaculum maritimum]